MRIRKLIGAAVILGSIPPAYSQSTSSDEAAIRDIFKRIEKYYGECDSKGMAALYAPDGERIVRGVTARGREAIEKTYDAQCSFTKNGKNKFLYTITFVDPQTANVDGTWINESNSLSTGFSLVARKTDGQWFVVIGRPR